MNEAGVERALREIAEEMRRRRRPFALVGGLAVSIRGEVRFTRDVDLAIDVANDGELEALVRDLTGAGYAPLADEQDAKRRLATVRLRAPSAVVVDLLAASSGIEAEIVERATELAIDGVGAIPVARAEELLALKVLSMTELRRQDEIDARALVRTNPTLDLDAVRALLVQITARDRGQDLSAKLDGVLRQA